VAAPGSAPDRQAPAVILGAGYGGLRLAHRLARRADRPGRIVLVDRHPVHVLRTELYEIGRLAATASAARDPFVLRLDRVLRGRAIEYVEGQVERIDLAGRTVRAGGRTVAFSSLAIALGSVPAYYRVPGAPEHTHHVYRLGAARALAARLRSLEATARTAGSRHRPRIVVVGGGSTGTEVAGEIATVRWDRLVGRGTPVPEVVLVTGAVPLLDGMPGPLVRSVRSLLARARVELLEGHNVRRVDPASLTLDDASVVPFDLAVWAAGVEAPPVVAALPVPHGRMGRLAVESTLEVPGNPGVFGVGDVVELKDPVSGGMVPGTAQAALAEADVAAANLAARRAGRPLVPFRYRERGVIVSVGLRRAAAVTPHLTLRGSPAKLLKRLVEREYSLSGARRPAAPLSR